MSDSGLSAYLLPLFAAFFLAVVAFGGAYLVWWDRRVRQRGLRLEQVTRIGKDAERKLSMEREAAFRSRTMPRGPLRRLEQSLSLLLPNRASLQRRLARAGLKMTPGAFLVMAAILGAVLAIALNVLFNLAPVTAGAIGLGAGFLLLNLFVGLLGQRRSEKFLKQLPDAIDIMIRSVRAGLPIIEGIGVVRKEFLAPLGPEFNTIRDKVHFGATLDEALWEIAGRIDRPEFNFFVICISVQKETGGNLTEALENLSRILRQREQMKMKVKALSSEARASAYILSAMPFLLTILVMFMNPGYLDLLFDDPRGNMLMYMGLGSLASGVMVMMKMVRFRI